MEWSGKEAFVSSSEKPFTVDGKEAGVLKSHGPLSFLKVRSVLCTKMQLPLDDNNLQFGFGCNWKTYAYIHKSLVYKPLKWELGKHRNTRN